MIILKYYSLNAICSKVGIFKSLLEKEVSLILKFCGKEENKCLSKFFLDLQMWMPYVTAIGFVNKIISISNTTQWSLDFLFIITNMSNHNIFKWMFIFLKSLYNLVKKLLNNEILNIVWRMALNLTSQFWNML